MMAEQQLFYELEKEYGFPRATYQLHIQLMEELMVSKRHKMHFGEQKLCRSSS